MKQILLYETSPSDVIEIVRELRSNGLIQGKDFDFAFNQATYDYLGNTPPVDRHTVFSFYDDKMASWFSLKYL